MAALSKLEIKKEEVPFYITEIEAILAFAQDIDCALNEAEATPCAADFTLLRDDEVKMSSGSAEVLSNANETEGSFFKLRKRA